MLSHGIENRPADALDREAGESRAAVRVKGVDSVDQAFDAVAYRVVAVDTDGASALAGHSIHHERHERQMVDNHLVPVLLHLSSPFLERPWAARSQKSAVVGSVTDDGKDLGRG